MLTRVVLVALASAIGLSACGQQGASPDVTAKLSAVDTRLDAVDTRLKAITQDLATKGYLITSLQTAHSSATFDPTDLTFQRVDTALGSFAVSITNVAAYGDGVRFTLNLGNPTSAGVGGVTLHLKYGPRMPVDNDTGSIPKWWQQLKTKDVELTSTLRAASWNPTSVVLPGIEPKNFGYLELSIDTKTIFLSTG